jgi:O-antigen/teichoic acid export membrane protein
MDQSPSPRLNFFTNATASWLGHAAQLLVAFFLFPYLVHRLGDARYGIWSVVESVLAFLMLMDLGVGAAVLRYVARFDQIQDAAGLNRVFSTSLSIFTIAGAVVWGVALGLAFLTDRPLGMAPEFSSDIRSLLVLLGANLAVQLPLGLFPTLLQSLGRYPFVALLATAALAIRTCLFVVFLERGGGLLHLAATMLIVTVAEHLIYVVATWRFLPCLRFSPRLCNRATLRMVMSYSVAALLIMVAGRIAFQTDAIVIGALLAPAAITHFVIGARLVEYTKSSCYSITAVLTPAISAMEASGDMQAIRSLHTRGTRYILWIVLPLQLGFFLLGKQFLTLWIGAQYAALSYPTLCILSIPLSLAISQAITGRVLYGIGRLRWLAGMTALEATSNLVISIALARPLGIEGVAWGTALPNLLLNAALLWYICRVLQVPLAMHLRLAFLRPLACASAPAIVWSAGNLMLQAPWTWAGFFAMGFFGVLPYAAGT